MLDCGFSPSMSSLSDRNMRLGDVLLPPGIKQRCLYLRLQGLFTLRKVLLMQLSIVLGLHFGWGSQLNTSEMFWIDISRWMISSRCNCISVYYFGVPPMLLSLVLLSSFGRDTSLVNITGPR